MKKGKLTKKGAKQLSVPHLAGKIVEFEKISIFGNANNIYYRSEYIGSVISATGPRRGIIPQ